jgi:hypothetical protein
MREGLRDEDAKNSLHNTDKSLLDGEINAEEAIEEAVDLLIQVADPKKLLKEMKFELISKENLEKALEKRIETRRKEAEEYRLTRLMEAPDVHDPASARKYLEENYADLGYGTFDAAFEDLYSTMIEPYYRGLEKGGIVYDPESIDELMTLNSRKSNDEKLSALNTWIQYHTDFKDARSFIKSVSNSLVGKSKEEQLDILKKSGAGMSLSTLTDIRKNLFPNMLVHTPFKK